MIPCGDRWRAVHNMSEIVMWIFFIWEMTLIVQMCYWLFTNSSEWAFNILQLHVMYIVASILIHCNYFFLLKVLDPVKKSQRILPFMFCLFHFLLQKELEELIDGLSFSPCKPQIFTIVFELFWEQNPFPIVKYELHHQLLIQRILSYRR